MTRQQKIQYLRLIQAGKLKPKNFSPLPEIVLNATTGDLSDVIITDGVKYPFYLATAYEDAKNGQAYSPNEVLALFNERKAFEVGCIPCISKHGTDLYCFHFIFRQISKNEQTENYIQHEAVSGGNA